MKNKLLLILLFCSFLGFSQNTDRELLRGKIFIDSLDVDNITVLNTATKNKAVTDKAGAFQIYARAKDTLVFTSLSFSPLLIVLEKRDFDLEELKLKLQVEVNQLNEVIVKRLSGDLERDTQKLKDRNVKVAVTQKMLFDADFKPDYLSKSAEAPLITHLSPLTGVDFIKVGALIGKLFKSTRKEGKKETQFITDKIFADAVREKLSDSFFTNVLKLKKEQIGPFLTYCDAGDANRVLLAPQKEFELIDFLISKSNEYRLLQKKN